MANTSMLHVRIEDSIKVEAAERLANVGLTVSDAVRILLTRVAKEGSMPAELLCDTEAYDKWFRSKVHEALNSTNPLVSHKQVMDDLQKIIDKKRNHHD